MSQAQKQSVFKAFADYKGYIIDRLPVKFIKFNNDSWRYRLDANIYNLNYLLKTSEDFFALPQNKRDYNFKKPDFLKGLAVLMAKHLSEYSIRVNRDYTLQEEQKYLFDILHNQSVHVQKMLRKQKAKESRPYCEITITEIKAVFREAQNTPRSTRRYVPGRGWSNSWSR